MRRTVLNRAPAARGRRAPSPPLSAEPRRAVWQHTSEGAKGSALALLAIAAYLPALAGGFVWDDWIFVTEPLIRRWEGLVSIWLSPSDVKGENHYWPIVYTTFWLEHKLWGFHAVGYHAVNILLNALNALLAWRLLRRLEIPGAWLAGAVFAAHPVHVESVAWIIERKDLLSTVFYLWAIHAWLRHTAAPTTRRLALCLALFTLAMLSKSIAVTLPATLLLLAWWRTGEISWRDVGRILPFLAVAAGITAADLFFYWSQDSHRFDYSAAERVLIAARAVWAYAGQLVWPVSLPILYSRWEVSASDPAGWAAVIALCTVFATLWLGRRRIGRGPVAALAFFVLTLSPVLGFLDYSFLRIAFLADRFQYLASLGPIALVAGMVARSLTRLRGKSRVAATGLLFGTVAVLCAQTWRQAEAYRDDLALAQHISTGNPEHYMGQVLLAHALVEAGNHQQGLTAARNAMQLARGERGADVGAAVAAVGIALLADDRPSQAEERFRQAIAIRANDSGAQLNLARTLVVQARYDEGLRLYREAAKDDSLNDLARAGHAEALLQAGNLPAARDAFLQALPLARDPRSEPAIHRRLGEVLHGMGELDAAAEHLDLALELNPRGVRTLLARAAVEVERKARAADEAGPEEATGNQPPLERGIRAVASSADNSGGRIEQAREIVEVAIKNEPHHVGARVLLATVLHRLGEHRQAIVALETALSANLNRPTRRHAHRVMGETLEARGELAKAADHYRSALAIYPLDADALAHLAAIHFGAGRHEDALPLYRRLAEVSPCNAKNLSRQTELSARLGRLPPPIPMPKFCRLSNPAAEPATHRTRSTSRAQGNRSINS